MLACLSRRTTTRGVVPGVQIPSRAPSTNTARYANRQSGEAQTFVTAGSTPACATPTTCVGWASASPTACKAASPDHRFAAVPAMQVQLLPGALTTWPVRLSAQDTSFSRWRGGFDSRTGYLSEQVAQLEDARCSERRARKGLGVQISPCSLPLQARQVPNWLRAPTEGWSGRCARFDTGACNCGWASAQPGLISLDDHRCAVVPGATPGPAT